MRTVGMWAVVGGGPSPRRSGRADEGLRINSKKALLHYDRSGIIALLENLPVGCRTVFNLYILEGMKHHEIAETLQISINTSKSQLILARQKLTALLEKNLKITPIR